MNYSLNKIIFHYCINIKFSKLRISRKNNFNNTPIQNKIFLCKGKRDQIRFYRLFGLLLGGK
ncbi:MAG: hypothetical protein CML42_08730 [Rhodobacteraceae bacterium]|nr:hypothetical protein [Paracoccaceae bacterium]